MDKLTRTKIREAYREFLPMILSGEKKSPYDLGIDFISLMSPIEDNVWGHIRYLGLPLYPQLPVGPYFLDFGDPFNKIGIEVDGRKWHVDKEKDRSREVEIRKYGWEIYRILGYKTFSCRDDYADERGILTEDKFKKYISECSEGILDYIYREYLENLYGGINEAKED